MILVRSHGYLGFTCTETLAWSIGWDVSCSSNPVLVLFVFYCLQLALLRLSANILYCLLRLVFKSLEDLFKDRCS
jgi:hypothetical protein